MKIYNFKLTIQMQELGDLPEAPDSPEIAEKFDDDPLNKADKFMSKWVKQIKEPVGIIPGPIYPGECNASSISRNFSIISPTFEDAQKILDRFHQLAKEIHDSAPAPTPTPLVVP